ncbi:MAG: DUF349 domain-containing protein [Bacteroidota bacterium]|nr:DUF349 domain-containing protein [Bacteroidota bacterium]MDX5431777.1 DUF349 domain-containing protein [Bacteroidota bacterium]MDX5470490.1 DUF349 domain-containing protein [Bacteroidota bacterium]
MLNENLNEETTKPTDEVVNEVAQNEETVSPVSEPDAHDDHEEVENSTYKMDDDHEEESDLNALNQEQLVELIENVSKQEDLSEAGRIAREVRSILEAQFADEEQAALEAFLEEGNEKDDFQPKPNEFKSRYLDAYKKIQSRRGEQRQRIEEEKLKNLEIKRRILEDLKHLTENDEAADALDKVKELQNEWKKIRAVPHEFVEELWDAYRFYLDKFYDNLSINFELKELDRKKNLEAKIELCKKVDELQEEASVKSAMNLLNKYHDEWKHTGPVPKEYAEEIWNRFKAASDKIFEQKKGQMDQLREMRRKNLELKTAINEKLEQVATILYEKPKEWIEKTELINTFFEEWKKIGPVPKDQNEVIWGRFKDLRNHFYRQKNNFFKHLNKEKTDNLTQKEALCERAEALRESNDWQKTTNDLIRLQGEWKKIGPVPEKHSDEVWKRFRAACDHFFNRKEEHFKGQKEEQEKNLEVKKSLLEELKALEAVAEDKADEVFAKLREIQKNWNAAGFVPIKHKNQLQKEFSSIADALYKKHKRNAEDLKEGQLVEHYEELAGTPDGKRRLQGEERRVKDKIRFLKSEIETLENNIGFFSNSKTAGPLIKEIKGKINRANEQLDRFQKELKTIKKYM